MIDTWQLASFIGFGIFFLVVQFFLIRWFFSIDKQLWFQQKQLDIIITMALKQGVTHEQIEEILKKK
jgi:hypothetical protein